MTNLATTIRMMIISTLAVLPGACGVLDVLDPDPSDPSDPADPSLTSTEVLERLGVNTDLGARQDPDGTELEQGFQPLSRPRRVLAPLAELYLEGKSFRGVLEDQKNGGGVVFDDTVTTTGFKMVPRKGDVDGDDRDEVVSVSWDYVTERLLLKVVDRADGAYVSQITTLAEHVPWEYGAAVPTAEMSMAVGDLDHDGRDEVAVALFNTLRLFDDAEAGYALIASKNLQRSDPGMLLTTLRLGIGSFYGDGKPRLFVSATPHPAPYGNCGAAQYRIFKDAALEELQFTWLRKPDGTALSCVGGLAVGDIDGDNLDEIVLDAEGSLWVMDDQRAGGKIVSSAPGAGGVVLLDMDADGRDEVVCRGRLYKFEGAGLRLIDGDLPTHAADGQVLVYHAATVGDIDGDLREELIVPGGNGVVVFGNDGADGMSLKTTLPYGAPFVVAANLDDDSLTLEYTGKSELRFTDPRILAVLAAPPAYRGIGQQSGSTTFGKLSEQQEETSTSLGLSLGFSVGVKAGVELLGVGAEVSGKNTFKAAMNFSSGVSTLLRTSYSYTGGADEDKVVFAAVPVDVYYYEVLKAADPTAVGTIVSINLPRQPQILSVTRSFYNANNGSQPDVGPDVLQHTIGEPFSYPSAAEREQHLAAGRQLIDDRGANPFKTELGGWINEHMATVGQGAGLQTLTIESSSSTSYGVTANLSTELEASVSAGVVAGGSVGFSAGLSAGLELNVTATEGFFVQGKIGDIPAEHFTPDKLYRAGIYAYPQQIDDQKFMVVNYWVSK